MRFCGIFLLLLLSSLGICQDQNHWTIGGGYSTGFILQHTNKLGHLITNHPNGFNLYLEKNSFGEKRWQQAYNYPDQGIEFVFLDYKNSSLGESLGLLAYTDFHLFNHSKQSHLKLKIAGGFGYNTSPFDHEENPKNNVFGSKFSYSLQLRLEYGLKFRNWIGTTSGTLTHFSNAAARRPNLGINVITIDFGFSKKLYKTQPEFLASEPPEFQKGLEYVFAVASGYNSTESDKSGVYPFVNLLSYTNMRINYKSAINLGVDVFLSSAIKERIETDPVENDAAPTRIGVAVGHELFMGRSSILVQLGYYVFDQYGGDLPFYQRYGYKYHITKSINIGLALKTHGADAELAEWSIGYRL